MDDSRRRFLQAGAVAVGGALAGCVGSLGGGSGSDGLTLETLSVGGSPGGEVPVTSGGSVSLLDFFATWCAPCKPQMKHLREVHATYPDVHLVSITSERDEGAIRSFWRDYEGTWPVALDPELEATGKYGADSLPTMVLVDGSGSETWRHRGLVGADKIANKLETAGATPG
jgi:thiol-disulfide isomerase/thioredoxin